MAWYDALWTAGRWFGSNWFGGASGPTTHTGNGGSTTPANISDGSGTHHGTSSGGDWSRILSRRRVRRAAHGGSATAAPVSVGTGRHRRHHQAVGASITRHHITGTGRRRLIGRGQSSHAHQVSAHGTVTRDDAELMLILAAASDW